MSKLTKIVQYSKLRQGDLLKKQNDSDSSSSTVTG